MYTNQENEDKLLHDLNSFHYGYWDKVNNIIKDNHNQIYALKQIIDALEAKIVALHSSNNHLISELANIKQELNKLKNTST